MFYLLIIKFILYHSFTIVITQPINVSICEEKGAVFTCVLNTTNTNITNNTIVQWYKFIKNTGTTEIVNPNEDRIDLLTHINGNKINSSLSINVTRNYAGYYWMGTPFYNVCNVSLNVLTSM